MLIIIKMDGYGLILSHRIKEYGEWYEGKHIKNINGENECNITQKYIDSVKKDSEFTDFERNIERYEKEIGIENCYFG